MKRYYKHILLAVLSAIVGAITQKVLDIGLSNIGSPSVPETLVEGKWYGKALQPIGPASKFGAQVPELYDFDMELEWKLFSEDSFEGTGTLRFDDRIITLILEGEVKRPEHVLIHYYDKNERAIRYGTFILKLSNGKGAAKVDPYQQFKGAFLAYAEEMETHETGYSPIVGGEIFLSRNENEARNHQFK